MGHLKIESTDHFEGILPVTLRVRPEPRWPGPIIAVPLSLNAYSCQQSWWSRARALF